MATKNASKRNADEKSLFVSTFGDYPLIRVLDFLITFRDFDYSKKDISKEARVSWNTLLKGWDTLIKSGLVKITRKVGKQELFQINTKSGVATKLLETYDSLIIQEMDKYDAQKIQTKNDERANIAGICPSDCIMYEAAKQAERQRCIEIIQKLREGYFRNGLGWDLLTDAIAKLSEKSGEEE